MSMYCWWRSSPSASPVPEICIRDRRLADAFPTFYFDSFLISSYPTPPKEVVTFTCRQLTGFGSSLETAVSDLKHYANIGMATVVLCQTQRCV